MNIIKDFKVFFLKNIFEIIKLVIIVLVIIIGFIIYNRKSQNEIELFSREFPTARKEDFFNNEVVLSVSTPQIFRTAGVDAFILLNKSGKKHLGLEYRGNAYWGIIKEGSILFKDSNSLELRVQNINQKDTLTYFYNLRKIEEE